MLFFRLFVFLDCVHFVSLRTTLHYIVCRACFVIESLKAFLFCSLLLSLEVQKVRGAALSNWPYIKHRKTHTANVSHFFQGFQCFWRVAIGKYRVNVGRLSDFFLLFFFPPVSQQVSITIVDENDNSPVFDITSDTSVDIAESTPMGEKVAVVLGRDRDAGLNGRVRMHSATCAHSRTSAPLRSVLWLTAVAHFNTNK